jgi:class 3 adenylate cyclase
MPHDFTGNLPGRQHLKHLLSQRNQYPDRVAQIDEELRRTFERRVAVLVLDMCGFSRLTAQYGIIHYLAMIHQMEEAATPAVSGNGGKVIMQEADNLFAIFATPQNALDAALDILRAFEAVNSVVPDERDIYGSVGIGYGDVLVIGEEDIFGAEVNLASKLGEDLAEKSEVLLTESAYKALPAGHYVCAPRNFTTSGMQIACYQYQQSLFPKPATVAARKG